MRAVSLVVLWPSGPGESKFQVQLLLLGLKFQRGKIVNPDIIPFFHRAPSLPILPVQVELDGFLGVSQVAQRSQVLSSRGYPFHLT
ncbi:hypothetical protein DSO57_1022597 [Entomophthora muscae]|uniref:Uncharacterized protein n=1 Tax=Entomophthora muscae TaxID=34485 RepID=A0ACC2UPI5_9FUNG|nr:hypothetical protein DSO57_1022597 [Entomophthora muscae]